MRCNPDKRTSRIDFIGAALLLLVALALVSCGAPSPDQRLETAKSQRAKGELGTAVIELKSLLQEHPEHNCSNQHHDHHSQDCQTSEG